MNKAYLTKFDEINRMEFDFDKPLTEILDYLYSELSTAYRDGWVFVNNERRPPSDIEEIIFLMYDGEDSFDRMGQAYADKDGERMKLILSTEYHRLYNTGCFDSAKAKGYTTKKWVTMADKKVRDTHFPLEGVSVPLDAQFYTFDGDSAYFPGGFSSASNNCNCRCWLDFA